MPYLCKESASNYFCSDMLHTNFLSYYISFAKISYFDRFWLVAGDNCCYGSPTLGLIEECLSSWSFFDGWFFLLCHCCSFCWQFWIVWCIYSSWPLPFWFDLEFLIHQFNEFIYCCPPLSYLIFHIGGFWSNYLA